HEDRRVELRAARREREGVVLDVCRGSSWSQGGDGPANGCERPANVRLPGIPPDDADMRDRKLPGSHLPPPRFSTACARNDGRGILDFKVSALTRRRQKVPKDGPLERFPRRWSEVLRAGSVSDGPSVGRR